MTPTTRPAAPARRRFLRAALALPFALAIAAGCHDSTGPRQTPLATVETTAFGSSLGIDLATFTRSSTGLYYKDVTVGTGATAVVGTQATVKYVLRDPNGTLIEQSGPANPSFSFTPGAGGAIAGFDEGVRGMKVGGRRTLLVPPAIAYGAARNYVLVFTVDLVSVP